MDVKKIPLDKVNVTKNAQFFLSATSSNHSFTFNLRFLYERFLNARFLYELKHKGCISLCVTFLIFDSAFFFYIIFADAIRCSRRMNVRWMFFSSVKEINKLRKEINRLLSKSMSNICFKIYVEKK